MSDILDEMRMAVVDHAKDDPDVYSGLLVEAIAEIERLRATLRRCVPGADAVDVGGEVIGLYLREDRSFADIKKEIRHGQKDAATSQD
jgi:hypothetical protein